MRSPQCPVQVLPTYLTSLIFRTCSLALCIVYLGPHLALLVLLVHIAIVIVVSFKLGFEKKDIFFLACTNCCIMSIGPLKAEFPTTQSRFKLF